MRIKKDSVVKKDQLIEELARAFSAVSVDDTDKVRYCLMADGRSFLTIYDKFNRWAYANDQDVNTSFHLGKVVKQEPGVFTAEVFISGGNTKLLAARVKYEEGV